MTHLSNKLILKLMAAAIPAIPVLAVTACSQEEEEPFPEPPGGAQEIRFAASTDYSRASDITTNNLTSFNVYAYTGNSSERTTFMDNVTVTKTGTNLWTYSPVEYWPSKQAVDFYAFAPAGWVGADGPLAPVAYDAISGSDDIVYAVSPDLTGYSEMANAQVLFNFRHALSKLTVKMSSTNTGLKVVVTNVTMSNIMTRGNFYFPSASTAGPATENSTGRWEDQNTPHTYIMHWSQSLSERFTLTSTPAVIEPTGIGRGGEMYVIPQQLVFQNQGSGSDTYISVQCSIYDASSGEHLWPNANTPPENLINGSTTGDGLLKFPLLTSLNTEWKPGVHYIYNLVINSNKEMGAIEFGNPSVDTFIDLEQTYE